MPYAFLVFKIVVRFGILLICLIGIVISIQFEAFTKPQMQAIALPYCQEDAPKGSTEF